MFTERIDMVEKKYELDKLYSFPVVGSHFDGKYNFYLDVNVNGLIEPVFAYTPQVKDGLPKEIQCRFVKDSNGEVYLRQDIEPLFPLLYTDGHKHLLEVVDLLDGKSIKVRDKFGISHKLKVDDGNEYSINELITRYVSVTGQNTVDFICQSHVDTLPYNSDDKDENIHLCGTKGIADNVTVPMPETVIPNPIDISNKIAVAPTNAISSKTTPHNPPTLAEIVRSGNTVDIIKYISEFKGAKIPLLHSEIRNYIENECTDAQEYCRFLSILFNHNASLFLGVVASADCSHIQGLKYCSDSLDSFLTKMLDAPDKIHHAFKILEVFRGKLSENQRYLIYVKSSHLNRPELYKQLFYILEADSNSSVRFLTNSANGIAARYALYEFYISAKNRGQLKTTTPIDALRISSVRKTADALAKGDELDKCISSLIYRNVLGYETKIERKLLRVIEDSGFDGFKAYFKNLTTQKQQDQVYSELVEKRQEYEFKPLRRLDNHYLLFHIPSNSYALLPISLAERAIGIKRPRPIKAFIYKKYADIKLLLVYQKKQSFFFRQPPIVDQKTKLNIHFVNIGGKWLPVVDNYAKFIKIRILNMRDIDDFKAKYVVSISNPVDFLTYKAIVVEKL